MDHDVIGDVHGQAAHLEALLRELGYAYRGGRWMPPGGRRAVFVGDLVDRGPEQPKVLDIVRRMVDAGDAHCVLGNHELNAIGWMTPMPGGGYGRSRTEQHRKQHREFLAQVGEGSAAHREWVDWFRTLPVALDLGGLRVVHAWWNPPAIERLEAEGPGLLDRDRAHRAFAHGDPVREALEGLTKGCELPLPEGSWFHCKDGHLRREIRTLWWSDTVRTYREAAAIDDTQRHRIPDDPLPADWSPQVPQGSPVFVGHYWLDAAGAPPARRSAKVACVDFSVARDGPLVAYRWQGEDELRDEHFVAVRA